MPATTVITRAEAVGIARSWIGTKYAIGQGVKGAGVDCARLLGEYLIECGFSEREDLGIYSHDWFCNTQDERYMFRVIRHAKKTIEAKCRGTLESSPGDLILFKLSGSRLYNHGGIITRWPFIVHSTGPVVKEDNCVTHWMTGFTECVIFDPWSKPLEQD